jgi:hypothetical protein
MNGASYWHAHAEQDGERLSGSDLDAIEAASAESAARRAVRHYWIERRHLFDLRDAHLVEIVVVVAQHLPSDPDRDSTTPTLGEPSRWLSKVSVALPAAGESAQRVPEETELAAIRLEPFSR